MHIELLEIIPSSDPALPEDTWVIDLDIGPAILCIEGDELGNTDTWVVAFLNFKDDVPEHEFLQALIPDPLEMDLNYYPAPTEFILDLPIHNVRYTDA